MKTIIIGVGNPVFSDDSVGLKVSRLICSKMVGQVVINVSELNAGGLRLMEAMVGYKRAVIVDAISTHDGKPGDVYSLTLSDLLTSPYASSHHFNYLSDAIETGTMLGLQMPSEIKIWAIEVKDTDQVSKDPLEDVEKAVHVVVDNILADFKIPISNLK